jgi:hypothetical protein
LCGRVHPGNRRQGRGPVWGLTAGTLVAPASAPGTGRRYVAFGDPTRNHFQVATTVDPAGAIAGVGIGVSGTSPVQQGILAVVGNGFLVLVRRIAGADQELARAAVPPSGGPVNLHVTAFDDLVRASVGDVVVEADRDVVREGRAALVADGPAVFSALLLDSLDLYRVDFVTSRYLSFADHVAQRDPTLYAHPSDAMGAVQALTPTAVLAAQSAAITSAMTAAADPQQREQLFSRVLSDVGLARLHRCDRLTLTRLTDATGTTALLLESPEPISFLHDTALTLRHRIWRRPPPWNQADSLDPDVGKALTLIQTGADGLVAPAAAAKSS